MSDRERVLVTGSAGCIGAWAVHELVREGTRVIAFDITDDAHRLRLVLDDDEISGVIFRRGDIRDQAAVEAVVRDEGVTHIVHLAALQVPFCAADPRQRLAGQRDRHPQRAGGDPPLGRAGSWSHLRQLDRSVRARLHVRGGAAYDDSPAAPVTLYGAYKQANEWTARIYGPTGGSDRWVCGHR